MKAPDSKLEVYIRHLTLLASITTCKAILLGCFQRKYIRDVPSAILGKSLHKTFKEWLSTAYPIELTNEERSLIVAEDTKHDYGLDSSAIDDVEAEETSVEEEVISMPIPSPHDQDEELLYSYTN